MFWAHMSDAESDLPRHTGLEARIADAIVPTLVDLGFELVRVAVLVLVGVDVAGAAVAVRVRVAVLVGVAVGSGTSAPRVR